VFFGIVRAGRFGLRHLDFPHKRARRGAPPSGNGEAAHLTGRGGPTIEALAFNDGAHGWIMREAAGVALSRY